MSALAFCTFDLKNATSQEYKDAYAALKRLGLKRVVVASSGNKVVIPTTSAMGQFETSSVTDLRTTLRERVKKAFQAQGLESEIFLVVGTGWAWGAATT